MTSKPPCFADARFTQALYQLVGQSDLPTWELVGRFEDFEWPEYDWLRSHEPELVLLRIKQLVTVFPTYQRRAATGRPPFNAEIILAGILLRGYMRTTFAQTESYLRLLATYFGFDQTPDANTLSRWNRQRKFSRLLRRFFAFILAEYEGKDLTIAVDSTGFTRIKQAWRRTPYAKRCHRSNHKLHIAIDTGTGLILSGVVSKPNVHDSKMYARTLDEIPDEFRVKRSLADGAYSGTKNLDEADERGISPIHTIRKDAVWKRNPETRYQRLVRFAKTFPNRFAELTGDRAFVETNMGSMKARTGDHIQCRHPVAVTNELLIKPILQNMRTTLKPVWTES